MRQRLLAINVFAHLHRIGGDHRVHVVRDRDIDRVNDSFLFEQLAEILVSGGRRHLSCAALSSSRPRWTN